VLAVRGVAALAQYSRRAELAPDKLAALADLGLEWAASCGRAPGAAVCCPGRTARPGDRGLSPACGIAPECEQALGSRGRFQSER
jgi:hypothetical protein